MNKLPFAPKLWLPLLSLLLVAACKQKPQVQVDPNAYIKPPIPELDPSFETFTLDLSTDQLIQTKNGTTIKIPANSLLKKDGTPAKTADVKFRAFQDAASIYLSGIPMQYDTAGAARFLETAGMFELRAFDGTDTLRVKDGANINVRFASMTGGNDYNSYYLAENERNWQYIEPNVPEINVEKAKLKSKIQKMQPGLAFPLNSKYFALNYQQLVDVYYNNNFSKVNEAEFKARLAAYGLGYFNFSNYDLITFKGTKLPASMMVWEKVNVKSVPEWTNKAFCRVRPINGDIHEIKIFKQENYDIVDSFVMQAKAIMSLQELFRFSPEVWKNDYKAAMQKIDIERERLATMAEVYRSLDINAFGIYNYDRIYKDEQHVELAARFNFSGLSSEDTVLLDEVVFVPSSGRSVIKLNKAQWDKIAMVPDKGGRLFALLPGNKLALYEVPRYAKIDFEALRQMSTPSFAFDMKVSEKKLDAEAVLREAIGLK